MLCADVRRWDGLDPIDISSDFWFKMIMKMMNRFIWVDWEQYDIDSLFLTCHNGWNLFYSSVGDYDPGEIKCELLSIKRGVPTNIRTGERKYRIVDAPSVGPAVIFPTVSDEVYPYAPRCATKVYTRTEHYSSRSDEFWLSIKVYIEDVEFPYLDPFQWKGNGLSSCNLRVKEILDRLM